MTARSFVVKLSDLEHGPKGLTREITKAWLENALQGTEATPADGTGTLEVELSKNGRDVLVRGKARVEVTVPCVVTLDPLPFELSPEILLVLEPGPEPEKGAKRKKGPPPTEKDAAKAARPRKRRDDPDSELSEKDAARDTFTGDEIVLDDFVREFIVLEIPSYPRRSDLPSAEEGLSSRPLAGPEDEKRPIDPRLLPLQGILERLRGRGQ